MTRRAAPRPACTASSTASGSFQPPSPNSLSPLSGIALCEAEIIRPSCAPSPAVTWATAGVGTTPSSRTSQPALVKPATAAASSMCPDGRGSRPTTTRGRGVPASSSTVAADAATCSASSGVSTSPLASPRTPSVPNSRAMVDLRTCREAAPASRDRLVAGTTSACEYWGALRAFFRPYFLRSLIRASRVRKPSFFRAGRSSGSTSMRARAIARRSAPAWPLMPPPCRRAMTSYCSAFSSVTNGSLIICWCTLLGKYPSRVRPLSL